MRIGAGYKVVVVALLVSLGACSGGDQEGSSEGDVAVAPPLGSVATDEVERKSPESLASAGFGDAEGGGRQAFAVSHRLGLAVAPDRVRPHFLAVKELCTSEARCELLASSASVLRQGGSVSSAYVEARLPHDAAAGFKERAVAPLEGEDPKEVEIRRDVTTTSNVTAAVVDVTRRKEQLEAYRGRLERLSDRAESRVEDLIRLAQELSQVQAQIEDLDGRLRHLGELTAAEKVRVELEAVRPALDALEPVRRAISEGHRMFWRSTAEVLGFVFLAVPWFVLIAVLVGAGVGIYRLIRRH